MNNKVKRLANLFLGVTIASLGIALMLNCDLGCFVETAVYKGVSIKLGIPLFLANILCQVIMIAIATYYGEGLGWTTIVNATYGAIIINLFHNILPHHAVLCFGGLLIPIGWSILEKARYGSTGTNILMKAIMKTTGKSLFKVRTVIESIFLLLAYLTVPQYVTWFTIALTFGTPILLKYVYKLLGHKPVKIDHDFIISKKSN